MKLKFFRFFCVAKKMNVIQKRISYKMGMEFDIYWKQQNTETKIDSEKGRKKMYKSGTSKNVSIQQPQFENLNDTVFLKQISIEVINVE